MARLAMPLGSAFICLPFLFCSPVSIASCERKIFYYNIDNAQVMPTEKADVTWLKKVFDDADCTLQITPSPSASTARRLQELAQGKSDILMNGSRLPERETIVYFSKAYSEEVVGLLVRKGEFERWKDLSLNDIVARGGRVIGGQSGWYGAEFDQLRRSQRKSAGFVPFRHSVLEGMESLVAGRGDVLVASFRMVQDLPFDLRTRTEALPAVLDRGPVHVMFSRITISAADFAVLDASIARLLQRGVVPVLSEVSEESSP